MGLLDWYKKRRVQQAEKVLLRQRELANPHVGLLKYIYNTRRLKRANKMLLQHSEAQKLGSPKAETGLLDRLREWRVRRAELARIRRKEVLEHVVAEGRLLPAKGGSSAAAMEEAARQEKRQNEIRLREEEAVFARRRTEQEEAKIKMEQKKHFKQEAEAKAKILRQEEKRAAFLKADEERIVRAKQREAEHRAIAARRGPRENTHGWGQR